MNNLENINQQSSNEEASSNILTKESILKKLNSIIEEKAGMKFEPDTNFLELGGNSIVAAQIIGEINQQYSIEIQIDLLLNVENVGEFIQKASQVILENKSNSDNKIQSSLHESGKAESNKWPVTSDQERIWFLDRIIPKNPAYNIYVALRIRGTFNHEFLNKSFNYILKRHELLRARFIVEKEKVYQIIEDPQTMSVPVEQIEESGIIKKLQNEASIGMDILAGNLVKIKIFQINETDRILFVNLHHIVGDAWSIVILLNDLVKKYMMLAYGDENDYNDLKTSYLDFINYQSQIFEKNQEKQITFWKETLKNVPTQINLPYDLERPQTLTYSAGHIRFALDTEVIQLLRNITKEHKVTIFNFLYSVFTALLYRISNQKQFLIGCPIANRKLADFNKIIGFFTNTLVMKNQFSPELDFISLMKQNHETSNNAFSNSDIPYLTLVRNVSDTRAYNYNPLFQVMFSLIQNPEFPQKEDIRIENIDLFSGFSDYDIFLTIEVSDTEINGSFNYSKDVFIDSTAQSIVTGFISSIKQIAGNPEIQINEFNITDDLKKIVENFNKKNYKQDIVISSTFSDQPVKDFVAFWMDMLEMPSKIELADYNQVFNQLLDPNQLMLSNQDGVNVLLIRIEDWIRYKKEQVDNIVGICDDFIRTLQKAVENFSVPLILSILPSQKKSSLLPEETTRQLTDKIISSIENNNKIYLLKYEEILLCYPQDDIFDEITDKEGHMPYTADFYKALSTTIARKIYAIKKQPFKVIILDCDNTLWKGVIGEDGIDNIVIDPARAEFQRLIVGQQKNGMLICLVSKNEESDIVNVLENKTGMVLTPDHITTIKANWQQKSENIMHLAEELNLGLDSFIFVDDNPVECAEVSSALPQVLTILFPQEPEGIDKVIKHGWFWDHVKMTETDKNRTRMYKEELVRKSEIKKHITFEEFYYSLKLEIEIDEITIDDIPRVSQLTQRTNQFNTTTIRRTESEISEFINNKQNKCFTVRVNDRFGDYGLVGAIFLVSAETALIVESLILSCRTLGKGVEYKMINKAAFVAGQNNQNQIHIPFYTSEKNKPVLDFLNSITCEKMEKIDKGEVYCYSSKHLSELRFNPAIHNKPESSANIKKNYVTGTIRADNKVLLDIMNNYNHVKYINVNSSKLKRISGSGVKPENETQKKILSLVKEVLNIDEIGIDDNFFDLGGYSIQLVQLLSILQKEFNVTIQITDLFQYTNIRKLAQYLTEGESNSKLKEIKQRGELQRQRILNLRK